MIRARSLDPPARRFWLLVVLILLLGAGLRLIDVLRFPLFYDEAFDVGLAHEVASGQVFAGLGENKWLYPAILGLGFTPTGPEGVWIARTVSGVFGVLTVAACIAAGKLLGGRQVGLIAGLVYAVLPMAVFHERQALIEPTVAAFSALSLVLSIRLARLPYPWLAILLGGALAMAFLAKPLALPFLALPPIAAMLLGRWHGRRPDWRAMGLGLLSIAIAGGLIALVTGLGAAAGTIPGSRFRLDLNNTLLQGSGAGTLVERRLSDLAVLSDIARLYIGLGPLALVLLAMIWIVQGKKRRELLFLTIPALGFALMPLFTLRTTGGGILPPRYFLTNIAPFAVLIALALWTLMQELKAYRAASAVLLLALIAVPSVLWDVQLIRDPWTARLTSIDRNVQYHLSLHGDTRDIAAGLLSEQARHDGARLHVIGYGIELPLLRAYLGPRAADILSAQSVDQRLLARWLAGGELIFVIDPQYPDTAGEHDLPDGLRLQRAEHYAPVMTGEALLYRATGAEGALADAAANAAVPDPEQMGLDLEALAAAIQAGPAPAAVLVYPSAYAVPLEQVGLPATPITVDEWPLDPDSARRALDIWQVQDGQQVDVIRVDEARSDPQRELALLLPGYYLREEWYGLVHRQVYLSGEADAALTPLHARWEDAIDLLGAAILDPQPQSGSTIRVLLAWQTSTPVQDPFSIFVHLVDAEGSLRAQHDGVPGGGLVPLTAWEPGETIQHRLAISLPADLPQGTYRLRVGIYHPGSGLRLRVTAGPEAGLDFVWVGAVQIGPAP